MELYQQLKNCGSEGEFLLCIWLFEGRNAGEVRQTLKTFRCGKNQRRFKGPNSIHYANGHIKEFKNPLMKFSVCQKGNKWMVRRLQIIYSLSKSIFENLAFEEWLFRNHRIDKHGEALLFWR